MGHLATSIDGDESLLIQPLSNLPSSQDPHKIKYLLEKHGESPRALMLGEGQREVASLGGMKVRGEKREEEEGKGGEKEFRCGKDEGKVERKSPPYRYVKGFIVSSSLLA